jgi:hypothetical protein
MILHSTHTEPLPAVGTKPYVRRKIGGKKKKVRTGPMHLQYTQNMRGVDVVDQLRGIYSCLTRSHKWWHRLFFYMLDNTVCNMWIIHSDLSFRFLIDPLTHQNFQLQLAKNLTARWTGKKHGYSILSPFPRLAHGPKSRGKKRDNCCLCG